MSPDRLSASQRGYDRRWARRRRQFLRSHPYCVDCGEEATVADHAPVDRLDLIARGVPDPDAGQYLQARCAQCHNRRTARTSLRSPTVKGSRKRPQAEKHPGAL